MEQAHSGAPHHEVEPITELSEGTIPTLPAQRHHHHEQVPLDSPPLDEKSSLEDEKVDAHDTIKVVDYEVNAETFIFDIRSGKPLPPNPDSPADGNELTVRALIVGSALGALVGASNIYLGLKTGWTFSSNLFGAIFGFAIIKAMSLSKVPMPGWFGGRAFTEQENVICQAAATGAGGMGIIFIGGVPALYQLGLLSTPEKDFTKWLAFMAVNAFFGMTFALALRKWFILKQKLVFPTPTATALTLRTLHSGKKGWELGKKKIKALVGAFSFAFSWKVISSYAPGILWDWHFGYWLEVWGYPAGRAMDNWWWYVELTPAFLGAGMLTGLNGSLSFYGGSILAWAIMGPALIDTNQASGIVDETNPHAVSYGSMSVTKEMATTNQVSPRYWLLFVGIFIMLVGTFVELVCNLVKMGMTAYKERKEGLAHTSAIEDPCPARDQISWKIWGPLTALMVVFNCLGASRLFGMHVGLAILSVLLGFLWSFVAVQSSGVTDINPVSTTAKLSQLIVGGATQGMGYPVNAAGFMPKAAQVNIYAGCIAGASASQAADMTGDLRTAHLLRARPKSLFIAQLVGAAVSIFLVPGLFLLFTKGYPCILDAEAETCTFAIPSVAAWRVIGIVGASNSGLPIPAACGYTALALGLFSGALVAAKVFFIPVKYHQYVPNPVIAGLAFTLPQSCYSAAMAVGAIVAHFWQKKRQDNYDIYCFAIAAGFSAGEGLGGCLNALLAILKVDGSYYGTAAGCPDKVYCG